MMKSQESKDRDEANIKEDFQKYFGKEMRAKLNQCQTNNTGLEHIHDMGG
jgi:hypothetical protein